MRSQELIINPDEFITFTGKIIEGNILTSISLENPLSQTIYFKVKTTKPDRYYVSPAHGTVNANTIVTLAVKLKDAGLTPEDVTKDKFLIQAILSDDVPLGVGPDEAFRRVPKTDLMESKLKVKVNEDDQEYQPEEDERNSKSFKSAKVAQSLNLSRRGTVSLDFSDEMVPRCDPSLDSEDYSKKMGTESKSGKMGTGISGERKSTETLDDKSKTLENTNPLTLASNFCVREKKDCCSHAKCFWRALIFALSVLFLGYVFQKYLYTYFMEQYVWKC